ncbi:hypothetical protein [Streptomyces sp. HF10]|uniref:hypothetical protein n=1 Tax=Streptomyces sp. HF10 TaxID=2692233 RepID=UPI0019152563|nr:hypothetical protein [Streptomyces sp. HF10]
MMIALMMPEISISTPSHGVNPSLEKVPAGGPDSPARFIAGTFCSPALHAMYLSSHRRV